MKKMWWHYVLFWEGLNLYDDHNKVDWRWVMKEACYICTRILKINKVAFPKTLLEWVRRLARSKSEKQYRLSQSFVFNYVGLLQESLREPEFELEVVSESQSEKPIIQSRECRQTNQRVLTTVFLNVPDYSFERV